MITEFFGTPFNFVLGHVLVLHLPNSSLPSKSRMSQPVLALAPTLTCENQLEGSWQDGDRSGAQLARGPLTFFRKPCEQIGRGPSLLFQSFQRP